MSVCVCLDQIIEIFQNFERKLRGHWEPLKVLGRIYIAPEGINGQIAVPHNSLELFYESCKLLDHISIGNLNNFHSDLFPNSKMFVSMMT